MPSAYFIYRPRRLSDLRVPHSLSKEKEYRIVAEITLEDPDFENLSEDLLADRAFLGEAAPLCGTGAVYRCLLIRGKRPQDRVLVVPKGNHVCFAAATV